MRNPAEDDDSPVQVLSGELSASVTCEAYTASGTRVATGDATGGVAVWEAGGGAPGGTPAAAWAAHGGAAVNALAFAAAEHGEVLASAGADGAVKVWVEGAGGGWALAEELRPAGAAPAAALAFAPAELGVLLAAACADGRLRVYKSDGGLFGVDAMWELKDEERVAPPGGKAVALCWAPSATSSARTPCLAVSTAEPTGGAVRVWARSAALGRWSVAARVAEDSPHLAEGLGWALNTAGLAHDKLAVAAGSEATVYELGGWQHALEGATCEARAMVVLPHPAAVHQASWSLDGTTLATAAADGRVRLFKPSLVGEWQEVAQVVAAAQR